MSSTICLFSKSLIIVYCIIEIFTPKYLHDLNISNTSTNMDALLTAATQRGEACVRFFEPLSSKFGIHVDQFNFVSCMFVACLMGRQFHTKYSIKNISADQRHRFAFLGGFTLALFCFGYQIMHLFIVSIVSYILISCVSYRYARYIVLFITMSYLAGTHLCRQYWDYGGYTLDITGPMMVMVQRLSLLAFNLHDGDLIKKKQKLDDRISAKHAILSHPTPLQFFGYVMNFQTIMIGPLLYYSDYVRFIESREIELAETPQQKQYFIVHRSSILTNDDLLKRYFAIMIVCGALHLFLFPFFQPSFYLTEEFNQFSFAKKVLYLVIVSPLLRQQYYFAWSLTSVCCLCSGLGFSGFNKESGEPEYDLIDNFDMRNIEMGTNIRAIIDGWNKPANRWLRDCVYNRVPVKYSTSAVFVCSAVWHGFYPGYYLLFFTGGIFLQVNRVARRHIRPWFLAHFGDGNSSSFYDVITGIVTVFVLNYMAMPFVLLGLYKSLIFWKQFYFCGHVVALLLLLLMRQVPQPIGNRR